MKDKIRSIPLEYGDAVFRMFYIKLIPRNIKDGADKHTHGYYELHFAEKGSYVYTLEDRTLTLHEGEVLIIPPECMHRRVSLLEKQENGYECTVLQFSLTHGTGSRRFFDCFEEALARSARTAIAISPELLQQAIILKNTTFDNVLRGYCEFKARAGILLYTLFDELDAFSLQTNYSDGGVDRAENLILLENLINQPGSTLKEIADAMYYSERHTSRLIHRIYGVPFSELKKQRKDTKSEMPKRGDFPQKTEIDR